MATVTLAQKARNDRLDIWLFIAEDNVTAADDFLGELDDTARMLAEHPDAGAPRPDVAEGLRSFAHGNYVIFYRATVKGIQVTRVIHGARDIPRLFD